MSKRDNFTAVLNEAIEAMCAKGFDPTLAAYYAGQIRRAAASKFKAGIATNDRMKRAMQAIYRRISPSGAKVPRAAGGMSLITLQRLQPKLLALVNARILETTRLLKENHQAALDKIGQRFTGWASSVPPQGSRVELAREARDGIKKELRNLKYCENRVVIDQSHKLRSNMDDLLAIEGGAIAQQWHSHWRSPGYNYRKDHKERDMKFYLIRGSWAEKKGLIKPDPNLPSGEQYTDQVTRPGSEIFCRCYGTNIYNLRDLPDAMLTDKGNKKAVDDAHRP